MRVAVFSAKPYDVSSLGAVVASLLWHFRCRVLAFDPQPDAGLLQLGVTYADLLTVEALSAIATVTLQNLSGLEAGRPCPNALQPTRP